MTLLVELVVEDVVVLDGMLLVVLEVVSELSPESLHADIKSVVVTRIGSSFFHDLVLWGRVSDSY